MEHPPELKGKWLLEQIALFSQKFSASFTTSELSRALLTMFPLVGEKFAAEVCGLRLPNTSLLVEGNSTLHLFPPEYFILVYTSCCFLA